MYLPLPRVGSTERAPPSESEWTPSTAKSTPDTTHRTKSKYNNIMVGCGCRVWTKHAHHGERLRDFVLKYASLQLIESRRLMGPLLYDCNSQDREPSRLLLSPQEATRF